jgi:hypothetical protein
MLGAPTARIVRADVNAKAGIQYASGHGEGEQ